MPALSCFTGFGFLEFSSGPSECEKIYRSLVASYRDPKTGHPTIDTSIGTHKEAMIFGWANALAMVRVLLRRAAAELRPETAYTQLEAQEAKFGLVPRASDTIPMRQAALAAKQKAVRGPRLESVQEALDGVLGDDLVAYRPIAKSEAEQWPRTLEASPGIFRRPDAVAKTVRILDAIARPGETTSAAVANFYANADDIVAIGDAIDAVGQSFEGDGGELDAVTFQVYLAGAPTGPVVARVYDDGGGFGATSQPGGSILAESLPIEAADLPGAPDEVSWLFGHDNRPVLESGRRYFVALYYAGGSAGNEVNVGVDTLVLTHPGNLATFNGAAWTPDALRDTYFKLWTVKDSGLEQEVSYENWNRSDVEDLVVKGDVLCIDPGNWGLVERVVVTDASGSGSERKFTARFRRQHSAGCFATDGPTPLWASTKRHVLVVASDEAAVDPELVSKVDERFRQLMRAPTAWDVVREEAPGTLGPFTIGATSGSPLGAVPLEELPTVAPSPPFFGITPARGPTTGGFSARIVGEGLGSANAVLFGSTSAAFTVISDNEIAVTIPDHRAGKVDVQVFTPSTNRLARLAFEYEQAELSVTSLSPSTGPAGGGTAVGISGTGFYRATNVEVNGFTLASWTIVSDSLINCVTDAVGGPAVINMNVETPDDVAGLPFTFT